MYELIMDCNAEKNAYAKNLKPEIEIDFRSIERDSADFVGPDHLRQLQPDLHLALCLPAAPSDGVS